MPITDRSNLKEYPGSVTEVTNPLSCTQFPTIQLLAKELQAGTIANKGATIIGGRIMTDATSTEITTLCTV